MSETRNNIKVFVRVRPLNEQESLMDGSTKSVQVIDNQAIRVSNFQGTGFTPYLNFSFDRIFAQNTEQGDVFNIVAQQIVKSTFEGMNGTIFSYGQTASGKTYTCVGPELNGEKRGLLPRIIEDIIERIKQRPANMDLRAKVSLVEIYNQKVTDLLDLNKKNLKLRENKNKGVFIEHVTERYISQREQGYQLLSLGLQNRSVGFTQMNSVSSRSHMLFIVTLMSNDFSTGQAKSGRLTVIDLAGSEKLSKTGNQGKSLNEAIKINTSLSALGNVIHSLSQSKGGHIPYRDSKLTRLLQESLGGNSLTSLIVNISPSSFNEAETITSLRFGQRAKAVKNSPKINKEYTVEQLLGMLEKAELRIKTQTKMIEEFSKKKRVVGYGINIDKPITMHIINDEDDEIDSNFDKDSQKQPSENKHSLSSATKPISRQMPSHKQKIKTAKSQKPLKSNTTSLKLIPNESKYRGVKFEQQQSLPDEQVPQGNAPIKKSFTRTRSQAELIPNHYDVLLKQNQELKKELSYSNSYAKILKENLDKAFISIESFKAQSKARQEIILSKNLQIQKLKQKNKQKKLEIEKQINNLKRFWENNNETDEQERIMRKISDQLQLKSSNSDATLKNIRTAQRTKLTIVKTYNQANS